MLKSELSSTYDFIPTTQCVVSLSTTNLTQAAEQNNKNASAMEKSLKSLTKASDAVTKAHDAQTTSIVSAAKQALQTAIEQATKLLESSKGNVSHEQTRTDLQKTVDDANALLQNDDATIEQLTEAREAMGKAIQAVTDSVAQYNADNQVYEKPQQTTNSSNSGQRTYYNPSEYKTNASSETPSNNADPDSGNKSTPTNQPTTTPDPTQKPETTPDPMTDPTEQPSSSPSVSPDSGSDTTSQSSTDTRTQENLDTTFAD